MVARIIPNEHVIRAFLRFGKGVTEATQRSALAKLPHRVVEYGPDERAAWLKALGPNCTGWVWRLDLLPDPGVKGKLRPSADYSVCIAAMMAKVGAGAVMMEGATGATSADVVAWADRIKRGADMVRSRKLTASEARAMGAPGTQASIDRSAEALLRTSLKGHARVLRAMWRSRDYSNREQAADAINEYLIERQLPRLGSWRTLQRALGARS